MIEVLVILLQPFFPILEDIMSAKPNILDTMSDTFKGINVFPEFGGTYLKYEHSIYRSSS